MATMTASNQQYYASYPVAQNVTNLNGTTVGSTYHTQQSYHHHHHHQQQHHHQHQHQQQQMQPYQHHQHGEQTLTQLGQRTVSATSATSSPSTAIYSIEATKSTKGASKLRRDLINTEIAQLRELLPLPASTRQRLSQLQLMALVLVYVRKSNYFCNAFGKYGIAREPSLTIPASGFSKALNGFLMMLTQKGKLLYISDNAAEYLGHSMEDLLSHGDEVYDIIEDQDKKTIRTELLSNDDDNQSSPGSKSLHQQSAVNLPTTETRITLCRMNVSRNARRQMRFGDQKVVLIEGHYFGFLPLSSRDEPVFLAKCTPIAMPETRECVVQGSTNVFTSIHSMDMKFLYIDGIGEHHLNCTKQQIHGLSWYELVHFEHLQEAQSKHKRITTNDQERSTIVLLRLMSFDQTKTIWIHSVMQVKEATDSATQPVIVCTNQVLSEREAQVMRSNSWLYQFYSLHSKMHCNFSNSPMNAANPAATTPDSVCSDSVEEQSSDLKSNSGVATAINSTLAAASTTTLSELSKSPPAISAARRSATNNREAGSPPINIRSNSEVQFNSSTQDNYNSSYTNYHPLVQATNLQQLKSIVPMSKLSPITHSPSSSSTISSSPQSTISSYPQQQQQQTLVGRYSGITASNAAADSTTHHQQHNLHLNGSIGSAASSSASSTSSSSSQNELATPPNSSNNLTAPNASISTSKMANGSSSAASLYAAATGIDAIDPLQHIHHSHYNHTAMYSAAAGHQHHTAAAAVNYANQMMAVQRVAHQQQSHHSHHNPYHPYHHQHHPAVHSHHHQSGSHLAPHHHNHHTTPHAALYGPAHHATASTVALNNAFNHHHHAAAAYHSAAAVGAHPAHHNFCNVNYLNVN